jgi:hypothetical protein
MNGQIRSIKVKMSLILGWREYHRIPLAYSLRPKISVFVLIKLLKFE